MCIVKISSVQKVFLKIHLSMKIRCQSCFESQTFLDQGLAKP